MTTILVSEKGNERFLALQILLKLFKQQTHLSLVLATYGSNNVSALTKELCFGVCRQYCRLELLALSLLTKRPSKLEVWLILLLGLYQLQFMHKAEYAVVKETVALLDFDKKPWAKGLVNAILRKFCREKSSILASLEKKPAFIYGHPAWLTARIKTDWPEDWEFILKSNLQHPPLSLRINKLCNTREDYLRILQDNDIKAYPQKHSQDGITLETPMRVDNLPGFFTGWVSVQDEAAQIAVKLLACAPSLRVLDACCAPGGKTCHILETQPKLSICVAIDNSESRLIRLRENLSRLHLNAHVICKDAMHPESWWDGILFDRILLDAPCSSLGVIRRHPDIKLRQSETEINITSKTQASLLNALWPLLAPGGILLYSTCSILKQENEQQIATFIATHSDCLCLVDEQPWGRNVTYGWQILPGKDNMDGFFYSKLKKVQNK